MGSCWVLSTDPELYMAYGPYSQDSSSLETVLQVGSHMSYSLSSSKGVLQGIIRATAMRLLTGILGV